MGSTLIVVVASLTKLPPAGAQPSPGLTGAFHYNVRLVSENFQVTSFAQSNPFLLV